MTLKERHDAQIELRDMAHELEQHWNTNEPGPRNRERAALLRAVAAELDRVPEIQ